MEQVERILQGDVRVASRLIRNLEDNLPGAKETIKKVFPHTGKAHVVGLTGSPGAGKSTLTDGIIASFRKKGKTVGVLAVDPTSPFTGGAILGDRCRMQRHAEDAGVFVRSLASRGNMGGLSKAVGDGIHVLDAMGKDVVVVETVGAGQQEVDIINHAHTVIVVLVPGMGDAVQAIKAGIMEIADIFVINKSDRDGAGKLYAEVNMMLDMSPSFAGGWRPPVIMTKNVYEPEQFARDVEVLAQKIEEHYQNLIENNLLGERSRRKALYELNEALRSYILEPVLEQLAESGEFERMVEQLVAKEADPYSLAESVARKYMSGKL